MLMVLIVWVMASPFVVIGLGLHKVDPEQYSLKAKRGVHT